MKSSAPKKKTQTSDFGSSGRSNHDSTIFYSRRLYEGVLQEEVVPYIEANLPEKCINKIFCKSSERMEELPDCSIHLVVTSPPYNVGKTYDEDMSLDEYREFIKRVMNESYRILVPGGRLCLNIVSLGRKPRIPMTAYITTDLLSLGFLMRGEIIWDKGASIGHSTAWGSWCSASNPVLRDTHEYILIFSKGMFSRPHIMGRQSTITRDEFLEYTNSIWKFNTESAKRIGHAAPFPTELPRRCIELYTYSDEIVLDPFMGSGTTAVAALNCGRRYVGYEINQDYVDLCNRRLEQHQNEA